MTGPHYTAFDRWVACLRHRVAKQHITPNSGVCDVGCGVDALFLKEIAAITRFRVGLDFQPVSAQLSDTQFVQVDVSEGFPLKGKSFDHVALLAVLEHLADPAVVFREAHRVLVPGGSLIVTWPNALVDPVVSVLMKLGIVSPTTEVDQHQPRKPVAHWVQLLKSIGFHAITHRTFELGLNNLLVARKPLDK